jgi:hypothetical protein
LLSEERVFGDERRPAAGRIGDHPGDERRSGRLRGGHEVPAGGLGDLTADRAQAL